MTHLCYSLARPAVLIEHRLAANQCEPASGEAGAAGGAPHFDVSNIEVVPGGTVSVGIGGGVAPYVFVSSSRAFQVDPDVASGTLRVTGVSAGSGTIVISDRNGATATAAVLVAPPAGTIPRAVALTLGGASVDPSFVLAQATAAVARSAHLAPGARVTLSGLTLVDAPRAGERIAARARVVLDGAGQFVDVAGTTEFDIAVESLAPLDPQLLMYSDDPETLAAAADGVLFADTIPAGSSARIYAYHASLTPERSVSLALRARGGPSLVEVLGASAGPSGDYIATGHAATANYLRARRAQESVVLALEPGVPVLIPIGDGELATNDLVAGIFDVRVLAGGPVEALTVAASGAVDPVSLLDGPPAAGDGHFRKGTYALDAVPALALSYTVGESEPAPVTIGMTPVPRVRAARDLAGAYGVVQRFRIALSNPSHEPAEVTLYEVPAGYGVTTTLLFDGEAAPFEVPCVKAAGVRYTVRSFALAPGERRLVSGDYMTDGASSYPLQFGLSQTPAATPGAC